MKNLKKLVAVSAVAVTLAGAALPVVAAQQATSPAFTQSTKWNLQEITNKLNEIKTAQGNRAGLASDLKTKEATEATEQKQYDDAVAAREKAESDLKAAEDRLENAKKEDHDAKVNLRDVKAKQKVDVDAIEKEYNETLEGERTSRKAEVDNNYAALVKSADELRAEAERLKALIPADPGVNNDGTADYAERKAEYDNAVSEYNKAEEAAKTAEALRETYNPDGKKAEIDADVDRKVAAAKDRVSNYYELDGEYFENHNGVVTQAQTRADAAATELTAAEGAVTQAKSDLEAARQTENKEAAELKVAKEAARKAKVAYSNNEKNIREAYLNLRAHADAEQIKNSVTGGAFTDKEIAEFEEEFNKSSEQLKQEKDTYEKAQKDAEADLANIKDTTDSTNKEVLDSKDQENKVDPTENAGQTGAQDANKPGAQDSNKPGATDANKPAAKPSTPKSSKAELPATGESNGFAVIAAAALSLLAGFGLVAPKFKKED